VDINPDALRQARVAAGLSLAQVGGLELTRQAVHLIETGKVRPSMRSLRVLAHRLQVPVATLLAPSDGGAPFDESSLAELEGLCRSHEYQQVVVRAREVLDCCQALELVAGAHYFMGEALCYLARPQEALDHLAQARAVFESLADDHGRVAETMELEALALQIAEDPRAVSVARAALGRYRTRDGRRPEVESRLLQRLGTILVARMEFQDARACYEEALEVAGGVRDLVRLARLYHGLAICNDGVGNMRAAGEQLFKAHTLYEAEERLAGNGGRSDLARVENDIGMMLMAQGDLARAEVYLLSALRRFEEVGLERLRSHLLLSLAELRQRQGRLDESIELAQRATDLAERLTETRAHTLGLQQLGGLHAARGERHLAESSFQRALAVLKEAGLERQYADCLEARDRALGVPAAAKAANGSAGA
jgi:tetratricopeptide (TPR) repeat protein